MYPTNCPDSDPVSLPISTSRKFIVKFVIDWSRNIPAGSALAREK